MEAVLTVRLDQEVKERGAAIMREQGVSPSQAVRRLFAYTAAHDALPFPAEEKPSRDEIRRRIAAFDRVHTKEPLTLSDDEIRSARLKERYGLDA